MGVVVAVMAIAAGAMDAQADGPPRGALDAGYGVGGVSQPTRLIGFDASDAIGLRSGHVVVAGQDVDRLSVARLDPSGAVDHTFGDRGIATPAIPGESLATHVAKGPWGSVYVAGWAQDLGGILVRLRSDGSLDTGFGDSGIVRVSGFPSDLAVNGGGQPAVLSWSAAGHAWYGGVAWALLQRWRVDGSADADFGAGGLTIAHEPSPLPSHLHLVSHPGAKLVIARTTRGGVMVRRLAADGTPDLGFATAGTAMIDTGPLHLDSVNAMAVDHGRRIVVVGEGFDLSGAETGPVGLVARLTSDGRLDPTFHHDGIQTIPRDASGRPIAYTDLASAGRSGVHFAAADGGQWGLVRLGDRGRLDGTFHAAGERLPMPWALGLAQQPGRVLAVGPKNINGTGVVVAAYHS